MSITFSELFVNIFVGEDLNIKKVGTHNLVNSDLSQVLLLFDLILLTDNTRSFDTLDKVSLSNEEYDEKGYDNEQAASILNYRFPKVCCRECSFEALGHFYNIAE